MSNGSVYTGEVKAGLPNGQGTMKYANGEVYEGEWKDGIKVWRQQSYAPNILMTVRTASIAFFRAFFLIFRKGCSSLKIIWRSTMTSYHF